MDNKPLIDFWGIGAQKSGTSWLYFNLSRIPGFDLPLVKEFHFFDRNPRYSSTNIHNNSRLFERFFKLEFLQCAFKSLIKLILKGGLKNFRFYIKFYFNNYDETWYTTLFRFYKGITGDITPSYSLLNREDIFEMYKISPNAKLILMLRNPIERSWSHYRHTKGHGKKFVNHRIDYDEVIKFIESNDQLLRSDYIRTLNNFLSVFPKEQIIVGFYDAIKVNPSRLLADIANFLGVSFDINSINIQDRNRVVNRSLELKCPEEIKNYLKTKYHDQIFQLANQYGGYFEKWYADIYNDNFSIQVDNEPPPTLIIDQYPLNFNAHYSSVTG